MGEIERTMSSREFTDWLRFEVEWPLPDRAADHMNALICLVVANIARSSDSPPLRLDDFLTLRRRTMIEPPPAPARSEPVPTISTAERFRIAMYGG